jgi:hypothetical protein
MSDLANCIYLTYLREFINSEELVFKLGKTTQPISKRMAGYPKGSTPIFYVLCGNCHIAEKELLKIFKKNYKQRTEYGREYFEGDPNSMQLCISNWIAANSPLKLHTNTNPKKPIPKKPIPKKFKCNMCHDTSFRYYASEKKTRVCIYCSCIGCEKRNANCACGYYCRNCKDTFIGYDNGKYYKCITCSHLAPSALGGNEINEYNLRFNMTRRNADYHHRNKYYHLPN